MEQAKKTGEYYRITKADYLDKTTAGYLSQIAGFLSGFEFVWREGELYVGMPDDWYEFMHGPYAAPNPHNRHGTKLLRHPETGEWETWMDDDYSIDTLDQYILRDMRKDFGTVTSKCITDGWANYDVYDMGGGNRGRGAYALMSRLRLLPAYSGTGEFGNRYNYCTEPWIGNETLGMNAAGMPNVAVSLAEIFGSVTGDRENVEWAKYTAALYAMAYFEKDIPTLIRAAAEVFPRGAYERWVIEVCFAAKEKFPTDWRAAAKYVEKTVCRNHDRMPGKEIQLEMNVNCGFVLLGLLFGEGDYETTCQILSLAGYDGDCTAAVGMSVLGIIGGMQVLPQKVNDLLWHDGKGVLVNRPIADSHPGVWMCMLGLPERMALSEIVDMYRENFEWILAENGGYANEEAYYIPKAALRTPAVLWQEDFEAGEGGMALTNATLDGTDIYEGDYSMRLDQGGEAVKTVDGLTVGAQYRLTVYVRTAEGAIAEVFARKAGEDGVYATVENHADTYVRRALVFTATAAQMELGVRNTAGDFVRFDRLTLVRVEETEAGTVEKRADGEYSVRGTVGKEILLKVTFSNPSGEIALLAVTVNGVSFNVAPLSKTGAFRENQVDFAYIPVVLAEGENTVTLKTESPVALRAVSAVTLTDAF